MAAELHVVTGKGGVGKSTIAAALALHLCRRNEGPVLLFDVQGSGHALSLLQLESKPAEPHVLPGAPGAWGSRLMPRETFKQYFSTILAFGKEHSGFAMMTASVRERVVDLIFDNRAVSAFVDVCPGLEPSVLLGKIHHECLHGCVPDSEKPWRHVIVDAPATGHVLSLYRSTQALRDVFGSGLIFRQATAITAFMQEPSLHKIYLVATPEELPLQEGLDIIGHLQALNLHPHRCIVNRKLNPLGTRTQTPPVTDLAWQREVDFEFERRSEEQELLADFSKKLLLLEPKLKPVFVKNFSVADMHLALPEIAASFDTAGGDNT